MSDWLDDLPRHIGPYGMAVFLLLVVAPVFAATFLGICFGLEWLTGIHMLVWYGLFTMIGGIHLLADSFK